MKLHAPAAERNAGPIGDVLVGWLPAAGLVLEVASGTGQHAAAFARRFPQLTWQPSEVEEEGLASIEAWREEAGAPSLLTPLKIDVREPDWGIAAADALLSINMVHISPWDASLGLLAGAARLLPPGGPLILYGPWLVEGEPTSPSNLAFDADLRQRNAAWGLRKVDRFAQAAVSHGLRLADQRAMPANNRMLLFRRA